jgi:radical SAM superfamily enzyme YgiQ (UPF0313 family)
VTPNFKIAQELTRLLHPKIPVILGGAHPSFLPKDTLAKIRCEAVITGEAEIIIAEVIRDLQKGKLKKIYAGILVPVEKIPRPARHLVDLEKYRPGGEKAAVIYTSRGCPFACGFCSKLTGNTYRAFPEKEIIAEIKEVLGLGFSQVVFGDDNIGISRERLKKLLPLFKELKINFRLNQDSASFDTGIARLAKASGCTEVSFGIESGSPEILRAIGKKSSARDNKNALQAAKNAGIKTRAYFVVNFPGENEKTVSQTLRFAEEVRPEKWLVSSFAPLPGSPAFSHPRKYGISWISKNWEDYYLAGKDGGFQPSFKTAYLTFKKQRELHAMLYNGLKNILG